MSYEQFKEFHEGNPDLDNTEYYEKFPETNKSTIRSWKSRLAKPIETPLPSKQEAEQATGYDEELVKILCTQTNTSFREFEGVDNKSAITILKNKLKSAQIKDAEKPSRTSNSSILPTPKPIGSSAKRFGLDPYIDFNVEKNEIIMEIPMDVLLDPERNKKLGEIK